MRLGEILGLFLLMYKITVYTLVNGRITRQKQQISGKGDIAQYDIVKVSMYC